MSSKEDSFRITSSARKAQAMLPYITARVKSGLEDASALDRLYAHAKDLQAASDTASKEPDTDTEDAAGLTAAKADLEAFDIAKVKG
jgi:hypothetical protein